MVDRYDISNEKRPTTGELLFGVSREIDPSVMHTMRVPRSIKRRMVDSGNKKVITILNENLPPLQV